MDHGPLDLCTCHSDPTDADRRTILPELTPMEGLDLPADPDNLLTGEQRRELRADLATMARVRRQAQAKAAGMWLP